MTKILFQDTFTIPMMCYTDCARTVRRALNLNGLNLNQSAGLSVDAMPAEEEGYQHIQVTITSDKEERVTEARKKQFRAHFAHQMEEIGFGEAFLESAHPTQTNGLNILINLLSIAAIVGLNLLFPPSVLLTITLTSLSIVSSTFTARNYIREFIRGLKHKKLAGMPATISLGVLLSAGHTLYHSIMMPLASSFSMLFMSFIMPIVLIVLINGMDIVKRLISNKSQEMRLQGLHSLYPEMRAEYEVCSLKSTNEFIQLNETKEHNQWYEEITRAASEGRGEPVKKSLLQKGMLIKVKKGDCFPVDGYIIQGHTYVDTSIDSGEQRRRKLPITLDDIPKLSNKSPNFVPSGAINLDQDVIIYAIEDSYNSTLNQVLFSANRDQNEEEISHKTFSTLYAVLIIIGLMAALIVPLSLGILTVPMVLENLSGILFTICPCTIALALELPLLLSIYQRGVQGIMVRKPEQGDDTIHTVVFDKTGTLTTGNSEVREVTEGITSALFQKVYLLEKEIGGSHPIAKAITDYYDQYHYNPMIPNIKNAQSDAKHCGLSGTVQDCDIHVGKEEYIKSCLKVEELIIPPKIAEVIEKNKALGYTPIYVAEAKSFSGVIFVEHKIREQIPESLLQLVMKDVEIFLLTGDTEESAFIFNKKISALAQAKQPELYEAMLAKRRKRQQKIDTEEQKQSPEQEELYLFESRSIKAGKEPLEKQEFIEKLLVGKKSKGLWGVGDALNDSPFLSFIASKGGTSCSITSTVKAAFFTKKSLNGSLAYLLAHNKITNFFKKIVLQNKIGIACSTLTFLAFIISFSSVGIAVVPLIPLGIMAFTTTCTLFNSYRTKLSVDVELDKNTSWIKRIMASDFSLFLLVAGGALLTAALLICTLSTGVVTLPALTFTLNALYSSCSLCILGSAVSWGLFAVLGSMYLIQENGRPRPKEELSASAKGSNLKVVLSGSENREYKGENPKEQFSFRRPNAPVRNQEYSGRAVAVPGGPC